MSPAALGFEQDGALVSTSIAILWVAAAYLLGLGLIAIVRPTQARLFLAGFAQTNTVNMVEAGLRMLVGVAFILASDRTRNAPVPTIIGSFLVVSALVLLLLPGLHRRFASTSTSRLSDVLPLFGLASLALALLLTWFIA